MDECLFVYGTLAPGRENAHVLADLRGSWTLASVRGTLLPDGWGAALGYPGLVPDAAGGEVRGLLYRSADLPAHWERLDEFEGEGYQRVAIEVRLEDGSTRQAWVYVLTSVPPDLIRR